MIFITIGVTSWGKGFTAQQSLAEMRRHCFSENQNKYETYSVNDPDAYVTEMGYIHAKATPTLVSPMPKVTRR